ncbi:helix-turn-helix domain-containing protein [Streptomyces coeruleoprunus]
MGLAVHIQSLPDGARIGIRFLAARFPESEKRIADALRELEAAGYLERRRERLDSGKVVTRTVFYNQPKGGVTAPPRPIRVQPLPKSGPEPRAAAAEPQPAPEPAAEPQASAAQPEPEPEPEPAAVEPRSQPVSQPEFQPKPDPATLPVPLTDDPDRLHAATALLAGLRRHDHRLVLSQGEVQRLAPAVAAWLERDAGPDSVRTALTAGLPGRLTHAAGLVAHRLTALLPPPLPEEPTEAGPDPFQTCEDCDRAFRAAEPGRCRDCRDE